MGNRRNAIWLLISTLLLVGILTGQSVFFNLAYLFGGLILLALTWSWLAVRGVRLGRRTRNRRSQVGHGFSEDFSVRNAFILPKLWLEIRDHSDLPGHRVNHLVPSLWPGRHYQWRVDTACTVRGAFRLGPMTIISGDPFGLFLTPRRIDASERMIVYPRTVPITQFKLPVGLISGGQPQRYHTQNVTTNAAGVRDYVPGDSINRVHWRSTARRNRLIVKEFELDPLMDIWLFVDLSGESLVEMDQLRRFGRDGAVIAQGSAIPPSTEEYAVVIAASIATYLIDAERALGFMTYAPRREMLPPERGHRQLTRILETLAIARSTAPQSMKEMVTLETPHITRGATAIFVTATRDSSWISELNVMARRGVRPMCIYIDPASFGGNSGDDVRGHLSIAKIPTITIENGQDLTTALAQRPV